MSDTSSGHQQTGQSYPLFYKQPELLRAEDHGELELRPGASFEFARLSNGLPVNTAEFPLAARNYPIVFVGGEVPTPVAMVGLRKNENLMIEPDGTWLKGAYIPAYVRRYPFVFVQSEDASQFALCIDRASDRIADGGEHPLFRDGEPSDLTRQALQFCTGFQKQAAATRRFCEMLVEQKLLKQNKGAFTLETGEKLSLTDFRVVDEEKLNALSDHEFCALRQDGALAAIYCHLISMNSWPSLARRAGKQS